MSEYKLVLNEYGLDCLRTSIAQGKEFPAAFIAVGDSNGSYYEPDKNQTTLRNILYTGNIYEKGINKIKNYIYFDMQIPASIGGFTIREAGLLDNNKKLLGAAKYPESYKEVASGTNEDIMLIELQILLSDEAINNITIDNSGNLITEEKLSANYQKLSEKGAASGYASLDENGKVPENQLPITTSGLPLFCFNSGPVDENGEAALITIEGNIVTLNAPAVCTTASGKTYKIEENITLDISSLEEGNYNLFYAPETNELVAYANEIYTQKAQPADCNQNDIWVDTSVMPYLTKIKSETSFVQIDIVPNAVIAIVSEGGGQILE